MYFANKIYSLRRTVEHKFSFRNITHWLKNASESSFQRGVVWFVWHLQVSNIHVGHAFGIIGTTLSPCSMTNSIVFFLSQKHWFWLEQMHFLELQDFRRKWAYISWILWHSEIQTCFHLLSKASNIIFLVSTFTIYVSTFLIIC